MPNVLTVVLWDDPILTQKTEPLTPDEFSSDLQALGESMLASLGRTGIGLAANQVGLAKRLFVMSLKDGTKIIAINPVVSPFGEYKTIQEGCLSFPDFYGPVCRQDQCMLTYFDPTSEPKVVTLNGLDAHCAQHENDHLNGIMFFERLPSHYRKKLLKQWEQTHQVARSLPDKAPVFAGV